MKINSFKKRNYQHTSAIDRKQQKSFDKSIRQKIPKFTIKDLEEDFVESTCSFKTPSVVIVGAGIAGLSAAQRLSQCGIRDIKILEATQR